MPLIAAIAIMLASAFLGSLLGAVVGYFMGKASYNDWVSKQCAGEVFPYIGIFPAGFGAIAGATACTILAATLTL